MVVPYTAIQFTVLQKLKTIAAGSSKAGTLQLTTDYQNIFAIPDIESIPWFLNLAKMPWLIYGLKLMITRLYVDLVNPA